MPQPAHPAKSQVIGHVSNSEAGQGPVQRGWAVVAQDNRRRRRRRDGARGSPLYEQGRKGEAEQWWQTRQPPGTRAMFKLGSLLDQQGKKREAKAVAAQSGQRRAAALAAANLRAPRTRRSVRAGGICVMEVELGKLEVGQERRDNYPAPGPA